MEGALEARAASQRLTGEWIVFARRGGKHYYLTLASHKEQDEIIYERVARFAAIEFPSLGL